MSGDIIKFGCFDFQPPSFTITKEDLYVGEAGNEPNPTPISVKRRDHADTFNRIKVLFTDRATAFYVQGLAVASDEVDIRQSGQIREKVVNLPAIPDIILATRIAYRLLEESMFRYEVYSFSLSYRKIGVEVGEIGRLDDGEKFQNVLVKILSMTESEDGKIIQITAVQHVNFDLATYSVTGQTEETEQHSTDEADLTSPGVYAVESPFGDSIFVIPCPRSEEVSYFKVYASRDGLSYALAGQISPNWVNGSNADGILASELPAHPAPIHMPKESILVTGVQDFVSFSSVPDNVFFDTGGSLGTQWVERSLVKVGDELIAFHYAELVGVSPSVWKLSDLIRGCWDTVAESHHIIDDEIVHIVDTSFSVNYSYLELHKTIYFKVTTVWNNLEQSLSDAIDVPFNVMGFIKWARPVSFIKIHGREHFADFRDDVFNLVWYFAGRTQGWGINGYGVPIAGAYEKDLSIVQMKVDLYSLVPGTNLVRDELLSTNTFNIDYASVDAFAATFSVQVDKAIDMQGVTSSMVEIVFTPMTAFGCLASKSKYVYDSR